MLRILIVTLLFAISVFANKINSHDKFTILARDITTRDNAVIATGDVVIFSKTYYITATKASYDKATGDLRFSDDVNILKNNQEHFMSKDAYLNIHSDVSKQKPVFSIDGKTKIWINSKQINTDKKEYTFDTSTLSSCDCIDPAWSIKFTSGSFDKQSKWLETFNTRLYIKKMPVLYTPYFGFSTDKTRKSGLLRPTFGLSGDEGFLYIQPIYIAPKHNWDLEIVPQIRTKRANGAYIHYRLADSPYSMLYFKAGQVVEKNSYAEENKLINDKHYGWDLEYNRSKLFSSNENHKDGLLVSLHHLNDIDYKNLEEDDSKSYSNSVESKINYFYKTENDFYGAYFRYYIKLVDGANQNNDTTLQQLPALQYHTFSKEFLLDRLFYSVDAQYTRYTRDKGVNADILDVSIPLNYSFSIFDDYINVLLEEKINGTLINYGGDNNYENGEYLQTIHKISLYTDLIKPYQDYVHTVNFNTSLEIPGGIHSNGDIYGISLSNDDFTGISEELTLKPFPITKPEKQLIFSLNHSLYDKESLLQIVNHKIKQAIVYDAQDHKGKFTDLENEISFNYGFANISNRLFYNHDDNQIVKSSSGIKLTIDNYYLHYNHYKTKATPNSTYEDSESRSIKIGAEFKNKYSVYYQEYYNIKDNISNKRRYYFGINEKCWSIGIRLEDSLIAVPTETTGALRQDIVYLQFELKPLIGASNIKFTN